MSSTLKKSIFIWLLGALFYFYQYIIRVSPNLMTEELMQAFSIDAAMLGTLISIYYISYSPMQIPLGITIDYLGPRRLLTAAAMICGLSCFLFTWAPNFYWAALARLLIGLGSGCAFIGTLKLATIWFDPKRLGTLVGATMLLGTSGATLGGAPLEFLIDATNWKIALNIVGAVGVLMAILIYAVVRDKNEASHHMDLAKEEAKLLDGLKKVIRTPQAWIIALFAMFMYMPIALIGDLWGVPFVVKYYNINEKIAATVISSMFIGVAIGAPLFSTISDFLQTRKKIMMVSAICSAMVYCIILYVPNIPLWMMYGLFFSAGLCFGGQCLSFASVCEIMPIKISGVAMGVVNSIVMLCGTFSHPLTGLLTEFHWDGTMAAGVPVYSLANYKFSLTIIPVSLMLSFIVALYMKDTYPSKYKKEKR